MITKLKEWMYSTYGVEVSARLIWMVLILIISIVLFVVAPLFSPNAGKTKLTPLPNVSMVNGK